MNTFSSGSVVDNATQTSLNDSIDSPGPDNVNSAGTDEANSGNPGRANTVNTGNAHQGNNQTRETKDAGIVTDGQVGPHATTVLRGEKTGVTPKGVKKGRDYIPRDSINNRTGLAPPK
jgi:hypothetical protein